MSFDASGPKNNPPALFVALVVGKNAKIGAANLDDLVENLGFLPRNLDVTPVMWDRTVGAHRFCGLHFRRGKEKGSGISMCDPNSK